jgi:hypothetical protein
MTSDGEFTTRDSVEGCRREQSGHAVIGMRLSLVYRLWAWYIWARVGRLHRGASFGGIRFHGWSVSCEDALCMPR